MTYYHSLHNTDQSEGEGPCLGPKEALKSCTKMKGFYGQVSRNGEVIPAQSRLVIVRLLSLWGNGKVSQAEDLTNADQVMSEWVV